MENTTKCSVFRTFQGWTALSDMLPGQGLLHVVPIPEAMAYVLLRPLQPDVPEDELCGVAPGKVLPVSETWHPLLLRAMTSIPAVTAGDSVWWHCDLIHGVAPVEQQQGWGNVMYIPAAPRCEKNMAYARLVATHVSVISCRRGFSYGAVPVADRDIEFGPMAIWEDARMGRHPVVLPGVRIGRGSIVGPGAALTSDLPPYSVAVGSPARVMRKR